MVVLRSIQRAQLGELVSAARSIGEIVTECAAQSGIGRIGKDDRWCGSMIPRRIAPRRIASANRSARGADR
jgi:hypothetical protein